MNPQRRTKPIAEYNALLRSGVLPMPYMSQGSLPSVRLTASLDRTALADRFSGALLGCAVGDALGRSVEGRNPGTYHVEYYEPWHGYRGGPVGTITDDTQMTRWLAESLLDRRGFDPEDICQRFTSQQIRGIGAATKIFVQNARRRDRPWFEAGTASSGNGAAMRAAPIGLFFRADPEALKCAAGLQAMITHHDAMAIASSIVMAAAVAELLAMPPCALDDISSRIAWLSHLGAIIEGMEDHAVYRDRKCGKPSTLHARITEDLPRFLRGQCRVIDVNEELWSGAYVLESLPVAIFAFIMAPGAFERTLLDAVNGSRDSDTVAAMACALSGAYNGASEIAARWLDALEWRDELDALGRRLVAATEDDR